MDNIDNIVNEHVRKIQIDLITGKPNTIVDWFTDLWSDMHFIDTDLFFDNGESVYYTIDPIDQTKYWIFYQVVDSDILWCNFDKYWIYLSYDWDYGYEDIQLITILLFDYILNGMCPHVLENKAMVSALRNAKIPGLKRGIDAMRITKVLNK